MSTIEEGKNIGEFLRYELDKNYCREVVTIVSGQNLKSGTVVGLSSGKYTSALSAATTGTVTVTGGTVTSETADEVTTTTITDGAIVISSDELAASAILLEDCDASSGDKKAVVLKRSALVARAGLIFPISATSTEKAKYEEDLSRAGIIVRESL